MTKEEIALQIVLKFLESRNDADTAEFVLDEDSIGVKLGNLYKDVLKTISND